MEEPKHKKIRLSNEKDISVVNVKNNDEMQLHHADNDNKSNDMNSPSNFHKIDEKIIISITDGENEEYHSNYIYNSDNNITDSTTLQNGTLRITEDNNHEWGLDQKKQKLNDVEQQHPPPLHELHFQQSPQGEGIPLSLPVLHADAFTMPPEHQQSPGPLPTEAKKMKKSRQTRCEKHKKSRKTCPPDCPDRIHPPGFFNKPNNVHLLPKKQKNNNNDTHNTSTSNNSPNTYDMPFSNDNNVSGNINPPISYPIVNYDNPPQPYGATNYNELEEYKNKVGYLENRVKELTAEKMDLIEEKLRAKKREEEDYQNNLLTKKKLHEEQLALNAAKLQFEEKENAFYQEKKMVEEQKKLSLDRSLPNLEPSLGNLGGPLEGNLEASLEANLRGNLAQT